jgi:AcrR family transcriptional regulator
VNPARPQEDTREGTSPSPTSGQAARGPRRLLRRTERRQQIIDAAKHAFVRKGYAATSLDDVAAEAGITRVLIYRHFDSKADLYQAVLEDVQARVREAVRAPAAFSAEGLTALVDVARADPDGFRLLFRHAAREPEFRAFADAYRQRSAELADVNLRGVIPDPEQRRWAAELLPPVTVEAIIAWLDAGQPHPEQAAETLRAILSGAIRAIRGGGDAGGR